MLGGWNLARLWFNEVRIIFDQKFACDVIIFADVIIFDYDVIIWEYIYNFRLNDANDFIFTPRLNIDKRNIFWDFGENPTWWRHFTSRDFIFLHFYVTWRKMTLSCRIFTKISGYVPFINIKLWCKYEVIRII